MKRHLCLSILIAATTLAMPAAFAGSGIVKCVDGAGHVTLTDQACDGAAATVHLTSSQPEDTPVRAAPAAPAVTAMQAVLPPAPVARRHIAPRIKVKPMLRDVATLKEARAQFLLGDVGPRQTLAKLD